MAKKNPGHNTSTCRTGVQEAGAPVAILLEGRLSARNVEALTGRLARLFTSGKSAIIIDFSRLKHADYRCLPSFASALKRLSLCGCRVTLCSMSDYVFDIFKAVGCDDGLEIFESKKEAVRALGFYLAGSGASRSSRAKVLSTTL